MRVVMAGLTMVLAASALHTAADSQPASRPAMPLTYADLADLALGAPVAAHVRITRAVRFKGKEAAAVPAGKTRFYVEADILSLIKGARGLPQQVSYLVDLPNSPDGRRAKLEKKSEHLLLASMVPGRPGELRLTAPDAQIPWSPERGNQVRRILSEASAANAPPRITGIGRAFHVPGSLPGESETQIFLQTADGQPVSLTVLRRPGERPRWAVALSEIVDDAAAPPPPETLLWYRLACTLPYQLPRQSFADAAPDQIAPIQADYRLVLDRLGPCARSRSA